LTFCLLLLLLWLLFLLPRSLARLAQLLEACCWQASKQASKRPAGVEAGTVRALTCLWRWSRPLTKETHLHMMQPFINPRAKGGLKLDSANVISRRAAGLPLAPAAACNNLEPVIRLPEPPLPSCSDNCTVLHSLHYTLPQASSHPALSETRPPPPDQRDLHGGPDKPSDEPPDE
jgi:hypothetical protein